MKILIVDDHPVVREGLRQILRRGISEPLAIEEASSARETLSKLSEDGYDVVLLDISLPDRNGLDALIEMKRMKPEVRVLVITVHPEEQYAVRTIKAGAQGYLTKDAASEELVTAVKAVSLGRKYITQSLAERLALALEREAEKPIHELLSNREYQVLRMIASGKSLTEIADEMMLSVKTVSTYRSRILAKMGMKSNAELIHYALQHHLLD